METLDVYGLTAEEAEQSIKAPMFVTVIGHTNHGKTSVVQTLLRDPDFGDVRDEPGVTRRVEGRALKRIGKTFMIVYDTPGLQYSTEAIEHCGDNFKIEDVMDYYRHRGKKCEHDLVSLERAADSNVILYVIDVSQNVVEKLVDDFRIVERSGVPIIYLFNFAAVASETQHQRWGKFLREHNRVLVLEFDAHLPAFEQENRLFDLMRVVTENPGYQNPLHQKPLKGMMRARKTARQKSQKDVTTVVSELLVDCAAFHMESRYVDRKSLSRETHKLVGDFRNKIADRENEAQCAIVVAYYFNVRDLDNASDAGNPSSIEGNRWFGQKALKHFGISAAGGIALGAAIGSVVDGNSFALGPGLGMVIGALVGLLFGGLFNARTDGKRMTILLETDDGMWKLLLHRSVSLVYKVHFRGAANQGSIEIAQYVDGIPEDDVQELCEELRRISKWRGMIPFRNKQQTFPEHDRRWKAQVDGVQERITRIVDSVLESRR